MGLRSCCRTNGVGSVASPNQLNVALTRARHHLIIVGMGRNLQKNELWKKIMGSVRRYILQESLLEQEFLLT
jgi:superfamily I DNA and/or RNA helicase